MTSVQRKFAASLIALLITLSLSYTGQTAKLTPDDCDENSDIARKIRECLATRNIKPEKVCTTAGRIDVVLSVNKDEPVGCKVIDAIRECVLAADRLDYELNISIAPSKTGDPAQLVYSGHTGTDRDPDSMPKCIDVLALRSIGTLKIREGKVEREVSAYAKRLGVRIDDLDVKVKKGEGNKLHLQVSGKVRKSEIGEKRVREIVTDLVSFYTGVPVLSINIDELNTDKLKEPLAKR